MGSGESHIAVDKLVSFIERNSLRFETVHKIGKIAYPVRDQVGFAFYTETYGEDGEVNDDMGEVEYYGFFAGAWKELFQGLNLKAAIQELFELGIIPDTKARNEYGSTRKQHRQWKVNVEALQKAQGIFKTKEVNND